MRDAPHREPVYKRAMLVDVLVECPHCKEMVRKMVRWDGRTYRTCALCGRGFAIYPDPFHAYGTETV